MAPQTKQALDTKTSNILASKVRDYNGVSEFTLGSVTLKGTDFKDAAKKIENGTITLYTSDDLGGFDAMSVGPKEIYFRNMSKKGGDSANIIIGLLVHELAHGICNVKSPGASTTQKEAACYVAQVCSLISLGAGIEYNTHVIFKPAKAVADLVRGGKPLTDSAVKALTSAIDNHPKYKHG